MVTFGEPLGHVLTLRGPFWVSRTADASPSLPLLPPHTHASPVWTFKTSPCEDSKRPRVYWHHAHMCFNMCAWCRYTRGRFESTHGGFSSVSHHTPHTTHTTHTTTTAAATTHNNTRRHTDRDRERRQRKRQRKRERERGGDERRKTREGKTKDKTREEKRRSIEEKRREDQEMNEDQDEMCCVCGCVVLIFSSCSKLPDLRIISNFHHYHYQR